ncbi:hypothetical protein [Acinetobacter baumannii]|uniref:hypothetical protein n=1 Tax=Acinetobacter baumannii TaxID=470 RepID=UPI001E30AA12|nr:hypothetical protein [Acinetobacter baumannii]
MGQQIVIEVPGTPISELEQTSRVQPHDVLPVVQNDETKKAPLQQIAELVQSGLGSASLKNVDDFATPTALSVVEQAIQQNIDATNERVDEVEFKTTLAQSGVEASFNSYAEMLAFTPSKANVSVRVNNDTDASKVGTYTWTGTQYKKGTDLLELASENASEKAQTAQSNAIAYTDTKLEGFKKGDLGDAVFSIKDALGRPVMVVAPDAGQYLVGLDGSTQDLINENLERVSQVEERVPLNNNPNAAIEFKDALFRVIAYFRSDAHLLLTHLDDSVQNEINALKRTNADFQASLSMTESSAIKSLTKGTFTADSAAILSMKVPATNSMNYIKMDSPYRKDDAFVHPCVIELYKPMRDYKYLMCITPYWGRNPFEENPTIYGSNDQVIWTMLTGFAQPLANPPEIDEPETGEHGYLSDNWWAYDPVNKELYCCYRKGYYANYPNGYSDNDRMQLLYRKTTNGLTWSKPTMFTPETLLGVDGQVAPSMIYDQVNKRWVLFYLKTNDSRIYVRFNSELKVDGWTAPQEIGFKAFADANNIKGWHIETKWVGNKLFMLIGDSTNGRYYFAVSNDDTFLNWTFSANSVLDSTWTKGAYKGSFLVVPQENGKIKLRMYFTDTGVGRFYSALSPDISIS